MRSTGRSRDPFALLLHLFSYAYAAALKGRRLLYRCRLMKTNRLPCRVVSIGNITVGGTGKTPMTIYVARMLKRLGYKTAVISRGYKGAAEQKGGIVSDGESIRMTPETAGDEPYLLAQSLKGIPVLVGRNRFASGLSAVKEFAAEVVVLDDAFQHIQIERDIDLVLLDADRPFGNTYLLPRGTLREPFGVLSRCDAVILTRCKNEKTAVIEQIREKIHQQPVFRTCHVPTVTRVVGLKESGGQRTGATPGADELRGRRIYAFSGLADNSNFRTSLMEMGGQLAGFQDFPDHHPYRQADIADILLAAQQSGAEVMATTEKDFIKISDRVHWPMGLFVVGLQVSFAEGQDAFGEFIGQRLN